MHMLKLLMRSGWLLVAGIWLHTSLWAHNGQIAHAYPLSPITVDGDLSDWPKGVAKYPIAMHQSDDRPANDADYSGYFQVGYRMDKQFLYFAFVITDNDFIEDTSKYVQWNSQDGLELYLDARHLPVGSGVASFMYSKKLRNTNNAYYDAFSKAATWDIMEVAIKTVGTTRYYEWRVAMGDQLKVGRSIGFDVQVFDRDLDSSFTFTGWGRGGPKYANPHSLGDVLILPAKAKLATISGDIKWDKATKARLPMEARLNSVQQPGLWVETTLDSLGHYSVSLPPGKYEVRLPSAYFFSDEKVYDGGQNKPVSVIAKVGQEVKAATITISSEPAPDLLPEKGILHNFTMADAAKVDQFIETYQKYYKIPGASLALIKDGKVVYHKTYGLKNTFTGEKVEENTLFEAASITKPVFAFAVQRLAERGVIDMDKPLYEYLPYPDIEYDERYKLITAKHVLTHRTGFPNWRDGKLIIKFTPGTGYGYSGEGFEYLKMVVEKITGKKVEQVLQEEVIEPMGLYHTFFSRNDSLRKMVANGHYEFLPNFDQLPEKPGMAYSMHTEAKIFTRFMLYLLEQKGLKKETYDNMFQKHSDFNWDPGEQPKIPAYMGMSLEIRETPFGKSFGHGGNNGDFKCKFEVYKDLKMGYVLFTNSNTSDYLLEAMRMFLVEGKQAP